MNRPIAMKPLFFFVMYIGLLIGVFFTSAGRWDLPVAWACIGVHAVGILTARSAMDPDLRRERIRPAAGGTDRKIRLMMLPFIVGFWVVAGLDLRWQTARMPLGVQLGGLTALSLFLGLATWAVRHNRFFSPVVRIQTERGHHLVNSGPYRFIRHPGYVGGMGSAISASMALGSWWGLIPAAGVVGVLLRRTMLEDRYLQRELPGYADYASRVRFRLLPGLW